MKFPPLVGTYLNCSVKGGASKLIVILGVDDDLHNIMSMTLKHLAACPLLVPVPKFDQHVICTDTNNHVHTRTQTSSSEHCSLLSSLAYHCWWECMAGLDEQQYSGCSQSGLQTCGPAPRYCNWTHESACHPKKKEDKWRPIFNSI